MAGIEEEEAGEKWEQLFFPFPPFPFLVRLFLCCKKNRAGVSERARKRVKKLEEKWRKESGPCVRGGGGGRQAGEWEERKRDQKFFLP